MANPAFIKSIKNMSAFNKKKSKQSVSKEHSFDKATQSKINQPSQLKYISQKINI